VVKVNSCDKSEWSAASANCGKTISCAVSLYLLP
jgi:hypothetical protein